MNANIFIGSSSEALDIAREIHAEIKRQDCNYNVTIWDRNVIGQSRYTIPELIKELTYSQFAIFVFHKDDATTYRGKRIATTRGNVIFECGLACSLLGMENVFVVKEKQTILPNDFSGFTYSEYEYSAFQANKGSEIGPVVSQIIDTIKKFLFPNNKILLTWNDYCQNVAKVCRALSLSPVQGGFRFDAIVGVSRGGIIAADMINRYFKGQNPLYCMNADYKTKQPDINFDHEMNEYVFRALIDNNFRSILIVDDISRRINPTNTLKKMLEAKMKNTVIKSAVIYMSDEHKGTIDYYGKCLLNPMNYSMPYSIFD